MFSCSSLHCFIFKLFRMNLHMQFACLPLCAVRSVHFHPCTPPTMTALLYTSIPFASSTLVFLFSLFSHLYLFLHFFLPPRSTSLDLPVCPSVSFHALPSASSFPSSTLPPLHSFPSLLPLSSLCLSSRHNHRRRLTQRPCHHQR